MCYDDQARPPEPPGPTSVARGMEVALDAADGNHFAAFLALPSAPARAQVLILPDVRGLHQFYKELALRYAEIGLAAIALDYFGRTAGIGARDESFDFWPHVHQLALPGVLADAAAALAHLGAQAGGDTARCSVGFCLGGTLSFICGTQPLGLDGVIGFYSGMTRAWEGRGLLERAGEMHVPALGLFGGADQGIPPEQVAAFDQALDASGAPHTLISYPGAPHSFFDRRATEFAAESADAWARVLEFIAGLRGAA